MATFSDQAIRLVDDYFEGWRRHDAALLDRVFSANAEYHINGARRFTSLAEIKRYWATNAGRQHDVRCDYRIGEIDELAREASIVFRSRFYASDDRAAVTITGSGTFFIGAAGTADRFVEHYLKEARWTLPAGFRNTTSTVFRYTVQLPWLHLGRTMGLFWARLGPAIYPLLLTAYLAVFLFATYMNFLEGDYFTLFSDPKTAAAANKAANGSFALGVILLAFKDNFRPSRNDIIRRKRVFDQDLTDLRVMCGEMKGASEVTIYSGDFSFLSKHRPLTEILDDLATRGNLKLVSYKDQAIVEREARLASHLQLIEKLKASNQIRFAAPERAKYSLVTRPGDQALLFRFEEDRTSYVGVLAARAGVSRALLETIQGLTRSV